MCRNYFPAWHKTTKSIKNSVLRYTVCNEDGRGVMWSPLADKVLYNLDSEMIVFCQVNKDSQFLRAMKVFKIAFFFYVIITFVSVI